MLSMVGLELTNFINPNLSWKKVTKGFRSTTRRSRKQTARNVNMVAKLGNKSPRRDGDSSVSESEKLVVAVLGRLFIDEPEHVPIKKRRLLVRSLSPSPQVPNSDYNESLSFNEQTASPRLQEVVSKHLLECKYASDNLELFSTWRIGAFDGSAVVNSAKGVNDRVTRGKSTEVSNGQLYYNDDFSGIELLAAAACSDIIGDDTENSRDSPVVEEPSAREGLNSSTSDFPMKDSEHECNAVDGSLNQEDSLVSKKHHNEDIGTVKNSVASKDDRLNWDLNTVMDAWGKPNDDSVTEFKRNVPEDVENSTQKEKLENVEVEKLTVSSASIVYVRPVMTGDMKRQDNEVPADVNCLVYLGQDNEASVEGITDVDCWVHPRQDNEAAVEGTADVDCSVHRRPGEPLPEHLELPSSTGAVEGESVPQESFKCYADNTCISKVSSPFDDCCNSNVSQDDNGHLVGVENITELYVSYDSPFEDGELRESVVYSWEENEGEDMDIECVDYESNYQDESDAADCPTSSEKLNTGGGCGGGVPIVGIESSFVGDIVESCLSKSSSGKTMNVQMKREYTRNDVGGNVEEVGKRGLNRRSNLDVRQSSDASGDNYSARKSRISACRDVFDIKGSHAGEIGSKVSRGKLSSQIEGPSSFYILDGKGSVLVQRGRPHNFDGSYPPQRSFICDKSMGRDGFCSRVHHRNERDDDLIDSSMSYWGSRDRFATNYRGSEDYVGYTRPRSFNYDYVAKASRLNGHDDRYLNYSSRDMCRPSVRRRSPFERDDHYGLRQGISSVRGIGFDRSWGRSGICRQRFSRRPRGEYHESDRSDVQPSPVSMQHYLARRERTPSPGYSRGAYISRPHNRSRSKTHSPPAWNLCREQSFVRRHCRSPEFRSDARVDRMRLPFQKCYFAADYEEDFISPPRGRYSLENNSRWINDLNCEDDHFRDGRSPVRMVRQRQRFNSASYAPGRSKQDDNHRTILHSGRFPLMVGPDRAQKFEGGYYDRIKHDKRYEPIQRVKRNGIDGVGRQSRYDAEDCCEAGKPQNDDECIRGTDRRDISGGAREEKAFFRCNNGTKEERAPFRYNNDIKEEKASFRYNDTKEDRAPFRYNNSKQERAPIRYNNERMCANVPSSGQRDPDVEASPARA